MKKISKSLSNRYHALALYRDDLEQVIDLLSEYSEKITIKNNDYVFENIDEYCSEYSESQNVLEIELESPDASISIDGKGRLLVYSDDRDSKALFYELDGLLKTKDRPKGFFQKYKWWALIGLPTTCLIASFLIQDYKIRWSLIAVASAFYCIWATIDIRHSLLNSVVYPFRQSERPSFIRRNKDALILNLFVGFVVAMLSVGGTLFVQWVGEERPSQVLNASNATDSTQDKSALQSPPPAEQ